MANSLHGRIRAKRKEVGMSQKGVAAKLKISPQAVNNWEAGQNRPDSKNLEALAALFGTSVDYLLSGIDVLGRAGNNSIMSVDMQTGREIPLLPLNELMALNNKNIQGKRELRGPVVRTHYEVSASAHAFKMIDRSMEPDFFEGDVIVIDPEEHLEPGDYVAAFIKTLNITTFRQFVYDGPEHCLLKASNPQHRSFRFPIAQWETDVSILGVYVEHTTQSKRRKSNTR